MVSLSVGNTTSSAWEAAPILDDAVAGRPECQDGVVDICGPPADVPCYRPSNSGSRPSMNEAAAQAAVFETRDHEEGATAFMEGRDPEFEGR